MGRQEDGRWVGVRFISLNFLGLCERLIPWQIHLVRSLFILKNKAKKKNNFLEILIKAFRVYYSKLA